MISIILLFCVSVVVCDTYNSTDLSYLSNSIQLPVTEIKRENVVENISQIQWLSGLYDHHKWWNNLVGIDIPECRDDMIVYLKELQNGTSWANKSK